DLLAADRFLREQYRPRFDGLSSIIGDAVLYQKTVRLLLDEVDITKAGDKLKSIMPQTMAMVITVTAATATGRALTAAERHSVEEACDMIQRISEAQETVVGFISRRTELIAPNLSALVGVDCAALLVSTAGGIQKLGCMSASELAALGKATTVSGDVVATNLATGGAPGNQRHFGHIFKCDIVQNVEEDFRVKCARMVAAKAQIAARVDVFSNTNSGDDSSTEGRRIREELLQNIEKLTAPPPQRDVKPLPIPGQVVKSKRAGRRVQRRKEMRATSELMQAQDRVAFGEAQVQVDTFDDGEGLGLIGTES
ncbi:Nop domain-containing protein, partial [Ramicandelaber brevisporus]